MYCKLKENQLSLKILQNQRKPQRVSLPFTMEPDTNQSKAQHSKVVLFLEK